MNKLLFGLLIFLFIPVCFSFEAESFVSFPGEKISLAFNSKVSLEMAYYYNLNEVEECTISLCPVFENNSLKKTGKRFVLDSAGVKPGFYAIKIFKENSDEFYYTSISIRPDYRLLVFLGIIILIGFMIAVKKNVFRK